MSTNKTTSKNGAKPNSKDSQPEVKRKGYFPSDEERRRESSKAAKKALELQKQARELTQAAAGAADPEERQKLLNEALNRSIEAESFGKTAKYLQSGTFQGFVAGGGMGTGIGVSLGALTGTIVGGVTSVIFGGLGSGIGSAVGAIHGPWFKPGDALASGIRKITGDLPGWKATNMEKYQLEKMIGQVNEQDRPSEADLEAMTVGDGLGGRFKEIPVVGQDGIWTENAKSYIPSAPWAKKEKSQEQVRDSLKQASNNKNGQSRRLSGRVSGTERVGAIPASGGNVGDQATSPRARQLDDRGSKRGTESNPQPVARGRGEEDDTQSVSEKRSSSTQSQIQAEKKKPRKLETRSHPVPSAPISSAEGPRTEKRTPQKNQSRGAGSTGRVPSTVTREKAQPPMLNPQNPRPQIRSSRRTTAKVAAKETG